MDFPDVQPSQFPRGGGRHSLPAKAPQRAILRGASQPDVLSALRPNTSRLDHPAALHLRHPPLVAMGGIPALTGHLLVTNLRHKAGKVLRAAPRHPGVMSSCLKGVQYQQNSFSQELDDVLKEQNVEVMAQGGTYVLKWLPYGFVDISGKRSLKQSYYRYGKGSPIPVYCENYITPMKDGYTLSIICSFQSNLDNRFRKDFSNAINSIRFK